MSSARSVTLEQLLEAVDFMSENQYAYGDQIPEDMEYNGFIISFRDSCQLSQAVVRPADQKDRGGVLVQYNDNRPMAIYSHGRKFSPREYFIAYVSDEFNTLHPTPPDPKIYGTVNGKPVYSREEYTFASRGFGPIESDEELIKFAEKETSGWSYAGWKRDFTSYYIDSMDSWTKLHFTPAELSRLKELQAIKRSEEKAADEARQWRKVDTMYWADNSVEEIWEDKDGIRKTVMVTPPHGDLC